MAPERGLDEHQVAPDPIAQFRRWFDDAVEAGVAEPDAMCLATVARGVPSARMVLLKAVDRRGFVFHTNYRSAKVRELDANPHAALVWRWHGVARQVRAVGVVERLSGDESDAYFATRERGSQIGAWASPQSQVLPGRGELERSVAAAEARFAGAAVPRPPWWGGLRVVPTSVEFWQGRADRLHDRIAYLAEPGEAEAPRWRIVRLAP